MGSDTYLSGSDGDVFLLLLNLVRTLGEDVDVGADAQNCSEIEETAIVAAEHLELGDDIGHYELGR